MINQLKKPKDCKPSQDQKNKNGTTFSPKVKRKRYLDDERDNKTMRFTAANKPKD